MDRRIWLAMLILLTGGVLLVIDQGFKGSSQLLGLLAVLVATAAWGMDNTLSRALADRDPGQVVLLRRSSAPASRCPWHGRCRNLYRRRRPSLACWQSAYGLSLRFYLLAQRVQRGPGRARCSPLRLYRQQPWRLRLETAQRAGAWRWAAC